MKISQKKVNGTPYYYAADSIYINRGKTVAKMRSLGSVKAGVNLGIKKQEFEEFLIQEEAEQRSLYWKPYAGRGFLKFMNIKKLETLRAKLFRLKKNMGTIGNLAMETAFLADFIYNSNKIEGSRVSRESIEDMVRYANGDKIVEVENTMKAIQCLGQKKFVFNFKSIEDLHDILLAHEPENLKYRTIDGIIVGNAPVSAAKDIKEELTELLAWNKKQNYHMYPLEQAFTFYYRFERIHPFKDGNGRTGRLLMNEILKLHKYHPIIIWDSQRRAHLNAFEKAMDGKNHSFFTFMEEQFTKTYDVYLEKIEKAYNFDEQYKYFLKPSK